MEAIFPGSIARKDLAHVCARVRVGEAVGGVLRGEEYSRCAYVCVRPTPFTSTLLPFLSGIAAFSQLVSPERKVGRVLCIIVYRVVLASTVRNVRILFELR